jgi:hypothetical protein
MFSQSAGAWDQFDQQYSYSSAESLPQHRTYTDGQDLLSDNFASESVTNFMNDTSQMWIWDPALPFG